jgi:hypothetical protein
MNKKKDLILSFFIYNAIFREAVVFEKNNEIYRHGMTHLLVAMHLPQHNKSCGYAFATAKHI